MDDRFTNWLAVIAVVGFIFLILIGHKASIKAQKENVEFAAESCRAMGGEPVILMHKDLPRFIGCKGANHA